MNKRGYIQDFLFFAIVVFIIAIIIVAAGKLFSDVNTHYQNSDATVKAKSMMSDVQSRYTPVFDYIFMGTFIVFALAIVVSMFMLDTHPVLFFAVLIVFAFILLAVGVIQSAYETFTNDPSMTAQASALGATDWIMSNIVLILTVFGFLGIVVLFAKLKAGY